MTQESCSRKKQCWSARFCRCSPFHFIYVLFWAWRDNIISKTFRQICSSFHTFITDPLSFMDTMSFSYRPIIHRPKVFLGSYSVTDRQGITTCLEHFKLFDTCSTCSFLNLVEIKIILHLTTPLQNLPGKEIELNCADIYELKGWWVMMPCSITLQVTDDSSYLIRSLTGRKFWKIYWNYY